MTTYKYNKQDEVVFIRENDGESRTLSGTISNVDYADPSAPYYVDTPYGGYWIAEEDITDLIGNTQLERIEAKLDAIIKQFNISVEGL